MPSETLITPGKNAGRRRVEVVAAALFLLVAACAPASGRHEGAARIALAGGLQRTAIRSGDFVLTAYLRLGGTPAPLRVYIEGDGAAWTTPSWPPDDPTPSEPVALRLAARDPSPNVLYLARPGQFLDPSSPPVERAYWMERRFAPEVVQALSGAVDQVLARGGTMEAVEITGHSGGAALAVLVAARRNDVTALRTVAGNLDPGAVNDRHGVGPLAGSLDPLAAAPRLGRLPQRHFEAAADDVIPPGTAASFLRAAGGSTAGVTVVAATTHTRGWAEIWPNLLRLPLVTPLPGESRRTP